MKFEFSRRWHQLKTGLSVPPDVAVLLEERDRELEDYLENVGGGGTNEIVFSLGGDLRLVKWGRYYERFAACTIESFYVSIDTAGTTNTVVALLRNGVSVTSATILAGANTGSSTSLSIAVVLGDYLQVEITTRGAGAKELVAQAYRAA